MKSVHELFTPEEEQKIKDTVAAVEQLTSGEIVPVIEDASYDYPRAELLGGLALSMTLSLAFVLLFKDESLWWFLLSFLICFPLSLFMFRKNTGFKRIFIHPQELKDESEERARIVFLEHGIAETQARSGVLIFISLFEKKVIILADRGINEKIPQEEWDQLVTIITTAIKSNQLTEGLCQAIKKSGELLAPHFPPNENDRNELPDLIIR